MDTKVISEDTIEITTQVPQVETINKQHVLDEITICEQDIVHGQGIIDTAQAEKTKWEEKLALFDRPEIKQAIATLQLPTDPIIP